MAELQRINHRVILKALWPAPTLFRDARPGSLRGDLGPPIRTADGQVFYRKRPWWRVSIKGERRARLLDRDGNRCVWCQTPGHAIALVIDHVIPVCRGGSNEDDNLQVLCWECNAHKAGSLSSEFNRMDYFARVPFLWHQGNFRSLTVLP